MLGSISSLPSGAQLKILVRFNLASEMYDPAEAEELSELVEQLFADARVNFERVSSRGDEYSVIESAIYEYIHWYDMPWEA